MKADEPIVSLEFVGERKRTKTKELLLISETSSSCNDEQNATQIVDARLKKEKEKREGENAERAMIEMELAK